MENKHETTEMKMLSFAFVIIFMSITFFSFAETCPALAGEYTIGKSAGTDFTTITEAVDAMKCGGLSGPVTLILEKGVYEERIVISSIIGLSAFNPLRFESQAANNTDAVISYPQGDATVIISCSDVSFENITIDHGATYGNSLRVEGKASRLHFKNVVFDGVAGAAEGVNAETVFFSPSAVKSSITFDECEVNFGTVGIYKTGVDSETPDTYTTITGTLFFGQSEAGLVLTNEDAPIISNNIISTTSDREGFKAIRLDNVANTLIVNKNIINAPNGSTALEINNCMASATAPGQIINNNITINGTTTALGINLSGNTDNQVLNFNRIKIPVNSSDATGQGYYRCTAEGKNINVLNNLFIDMNTGTYTVLGNSYKDFFNQLPAQSNKALTASANSISLERGKMK